MLQTITLLSTKHPKQHLITTTNTQNTKADPELLLALRKQRLERRLTNLEPCIFQFTPKTSGAEPITRAEEVNLSLERANCIELEQHNSPPNILPIKMTLTA